MSGKIASKAGWLGYFVLSAAALAAASCADDKWTEGVSTDTMPIIDGEVDTGDPAVVLVIIQNDTNGAICTGTVVSPHVVATAAHCVHPEVLEPLGPGVQFYIFLGNDVNDPAQLDDPDNFVYVDKVLHHPEFDPSDVGSAAPPHDVGAIVTETPIPVTPIPIRRSAIGQEWVGQPARVIGYGLTTPGEPDTSGAKQQGVVTIAGIDDDHLWFDATGPRACGGDSGGAMLITQNDVESLAGVHSWVEQVATCNGDSYDIRADVELTGLVDPLIAEYDPDFVPPGDGSDQGGQGGEGGGGGGAEGGAGGSAGAAPSPNADAADEDDGCSAASGARHAQSTWMFLILAALGVALSRRHRRPRHPVGAQPSTGRAGAVATLEAAPPARHRSA